MVERGLGGPGAASPPVWLCVALGFVLGLARPAAGDPADAGWRVVREAEGIELARRDGELPTFRGVTVIEASLPRVLAVLRDVSRHVEWRSGCVEARILARESPTVALLYNRIEGVWPVADRDAVLHSETHVVGPDAARIDVRAVESPLAPEAADAVRMPRLEGSYALRALGPERTRVEYRMQLSLGGAVPAWIMRIVAEDMPIATLSGLRRQVAQTRGVYDAFVHDWSEASARGELPRRLRATQAPVHAGPDG